jgi:hypothetical protein
MRKNYGNTTKGNGTKADPEFSEEIRKVIDLHRKEADAAKEVVRRLNRLQQFAETQGGIPQANINEIAQANDILNQTERQADEAIIRFANKWFE